MSGKGAGRDPGRPNTLRDQAIPNVLPAPQVHVAPIGHTDEVADTRADARPVRPESREQPPDATAGERSAAGEIATRLYALARRLTIESERVQARLLEGFRAEAAPLASQCGDLIVRDFDDERLSYRADGSFSGEIVPKGAPDSWRQLETALDVVAIYDPSDLFAYLADRLEAAYPSVGDPGAEDAGPRLRHLAEAFAERPAPTERRAESAEIGLIKRFGTAAAPFTRELGDIVFVDEEDERLTLKRSGHIVGEVIPEGDETNWRTLRNLGELTEFYSPEELFGILAGKLATDYPAPSDEGPEAAAAALHDLAVAWREQSLDAEARLFAEFNQDSAGFPRTMGEFVIVDDDDEQLALDEDGQLVARVLERSSGVWHELDGPDELVQAYDPADVFADIADALAEAFPGLASTEDGDEAPGS